MGVIGILYAVFVLLLLSVGNEIATGIAVGMILFAAGIGIAWVVLK